MLQNNHYHKSLKINNDQYLKQAFYTCTQLQSAIVNSEPATYKKVASFIGDNSVLFRSTLSNFNL